MTLSSLVCRHAGKASRPGGGCTACSGTMPQWNKSTARVLSRLRKFSLPTEQWQPTERENAAIDRVWAFVGVRREEYDDNKNNHWDFVGAGLPKSEKLALRAGVRERLLTVFAQTAFSEDGDEAPVVGAVRLCW